MMKAKQKSLIAIVVAVLCVCLGVSAELFSPATARAESAWTADSGWTESNGTYTVVNAGGARIFYSGDEAWDTVEFDYIPNTVDAQGTANIAVVFGDLDYFVGYYPVLGTAAIYSTNNTVELAANKEGNITCTNGVAIRIKVEFDLTKTRLSIGGREVLSTKALTYAQIKDFDMYLWTWGAYGQVAAPAVTRQLSGAEDTEPLLWTPSGNWTVTEESGTTKYAMADNEGKRILYTGGKTFNTLRFSYAPTGANNWWNGNVGFLFQRDGADVFFFGVYPAEGQVRVLLNGGSETVYPCTLTADVECDFEVGFTADGAVIRADGEYITTVESATVDAIKDLDLFLWSWGATGYVTNLTATTEDVEPSVVKPAWIADSNWVAGTDGATETLTKTGDLGVAATISYNTPVDANTFSMDVRTGEHWSGDGNIGLMVYLAGGQQYFLEANVAARIIRMRRWASSSANEEWLAVSDTVIPEEDDAWFALSFIFDEYWLEAFVNGTSALRVQLANEDVFEGARLMVSSWGALPTVKNLAITSTELELEEIAWAIPSGWSKTVEGEDTVYTNDSGEINTVTRVLPNNDTYNTFSFDLRVNELKSEQDANIGASIKVASGESFFFEYNPAPTRAYARLRYFPVGSAEGVEYGRKSIAIAPFTEWVNIKVVFDTDYLLFYINGTRVLSAFDTYGHDMTQARAGLSTWLTYGSVKNFALSESEIDIASSGYVDLEFASKLAVDTFTAKNGTVSYADGALHMAVTGANPVLTSGDIDVGKGTRYSMRLSVRNTFAVRLKNQTAATGISLQYITSKDRVYNEAKQKDFAIEPNSDYKTYYFNISDVADCGHWVDRTQLAKCDCYLAGFRFTFKGAATGNIAIDAVTFEREDRIYEKAATDVVATAPEQTVTVTGKVLAKYAGGTVKVYRTGIENYNELLNWHENELLGTATAGADGAFTVTFPMQRAGTKINHLSSKFLAEVDGNKLCDAFVIRNWEDFTDNPYAFTIPNNLTVDVTDAPYNAKGDGFTNDNAAIQAAVDAVSAAGGGTVVIPGDDSEYGRRYVAYNINIKSNVELRIEKGAILWQSSRIEEYDYGDYEPALGHDVVIEGTAWTHAAPCWNKPFLFVYDAQNVRITGGGEIRMCDQGQEWLDGNSYSWDSDITANCNTFVHIHPIAATRSSNLDFNNLTITRGSIWHVNNFQTSSVRIGNINVTEVSCINGDGFGSFAVNGIVIDRCFLYSNDDAATIASGYDDPRNYGHSWMRSDPDGDNRCINYVIRNSNLFGGHGITFINWGSNNPNAEMSEIAGVRVYNNELGGTSTAVGCWPDNPYYGSSGLGTYDQCEQDDYSAIRDVWIYDNVYTAPTLLATWDGNPPEIAPVTNAYTDCGIFAEPDFINGDFDRDLRYDNELEWTSGTTYWSRTLGENGSVGTEQSGTKQGVIKETGATVTQNNYLGYAKGNAELYQGLYRTYGAYEAKLDARLAGGTATLFVRNGVTGEVIAEQTLARSDTLATYTLRFTLTKAATVQIGVRHEGGANDAVYLDNASLAVDPTVTDLYEVVGETKVWDLEGDSPAFEYYGGSGITVADGVMTIEGGTEYKIMLGDRTYAELDVSMDIAVNDMINTGFYLFASRVAAGQDKITAYNVQVERKEGEGKYSVKLYAFDQDYLGSVADGGSYELGDSTKITLRVLVKNSTVCVFVNGGATPILAYEVEEGLRGQVGIRVQHAVTVIDNIALTAKADRTRLDSVIALGEGYDGTRYTPTSYAALRAAIANAKALATTATQAEVNAATTNITDAINGLVARADLTALHAVVSEAGEKADTDYTEDSWMRLQEALAQKDTLTADSTQFEVDAVTGAIRAALDGLTEKPASPKGKGGCGGSVAAGGIAGLLVLLGAGVLLRRKSA